MDERITIASWEDRINQQIWTSERSVTLLFGITLFVSAALLFSVQPMVAKMLLPLLGGTPAVWNTCMLFFQAALLAGYAYALLVSKWPFRQQLMLQLLLLALAFVSLPIGLSPAWVNSVPATGNPSSWLLTCLAALVGLPFFIVSSNGPLLQKWFSQTGHSSARDPYFLYSASNAGSLMALLAYPVLLEPNFNLRLQSRIWAAGYAALLLLVGTCGLALWQVHRNRVKNDPVDPPMTPALVDPSPSSVEKHMATQSVGRRLRWVLLAFVPSSLMLGVTNYISTDIASVPLLWVIPLALYLLTLVIAFARRQVISLRVLAVILPGATLVFLFIYLLDISAGPGLMISFNLIYFFLAALTCHIQLAADRPATTHLPEFYLWMSLGGVLGGVVNALLAPMIFSSVTEYPLAMLLACLLLPSGAESTGARRKRWMDFLLPAGVLLFTVALSLVVHKVTPGKLTGLVVAFSVPMIIIYPFRKQPLRFALCLGAIMLGANLVTFVGNKTLHAERNFFGVLRVAQNASGTMHTLIHGSTIHGRQYTGVDHQCEPLSYYHRTGPLGQIFAAFQSSLAAKDVAIVGLGAGATAVYAQPNERWTFYEINPAVVNIARNPSYFTYVVDCAQVPLNVVLGDARLRLREAPDARYGLIVLDVFSSDAIPIHLITQQAIDLYLSKLAAGGLLVFHVSNRNLDLSPVLADLARSRSLNCIVLDDARSIEVEGKDSSLWVVMARSPAELAELTKSSDARFLLADDHREVWTDDFSNILSLFKWW
jgi:spermidine synthase